MSEAEVAGRLEVPVEADLAGFKQKLKAGVDKAAEGITAKIGVELGTPRDLRARLKAAVDEAARGIKATVTVAVKVDKKRVKAEVTAAVEEGKATARRNPIRVIVEAKDNLRARAAAWISEMNLFAKKNPVKVSVQADTKGKGKDGKGFIEGLGKALSGMLGPARMLSMAGLVQPAVSAIGQAVGGLASMVANLGQVVNLAGAAPALIGALGLSLLTAKTAFKGFTGPLANMKAGPIKDARLAIDGLTKSWAKLTADVQKSFWTKTLTKDLSGLSKTVIPTLNKGMQAIAKTQSGILDRVIRQVGSKQGQSQLGVMLREANNLTGHLGNLILGGVKGFMQMAVAAEPITKKVGKVTDNLGKWAGQLAAPGAGAKRFADMLERAWVMGGKAWAIVKDLGHIIAGIFQAGRGTGDSLLDSFITNLDKLNVWVHGEGAAKIQKWFKDLEPGARAAGNLINAIVKGLFSMTQNASTGTMLDQLTAAIPSIAKFLTDLGNTLGPKIVAVVGDLAKIIGTQGSIGSPLAGALGMLEPPLRALGDWLSSHPGFAHDMGLVLASLTAFKVLKFLGGATGVGSLISGLGGALGGLGKMGALGGFGGKVAGKAGGLGSLFGGGIKVSWSTPMPVFVTNKGIGGGLAGDGLDAAGGLGGEGKNLGKAAKAAKGILKVAGWIGVFATIADMIPAGALDPKKGQPGHQQTGSVLDGILGADWLHPVPKQAPGGYAPPSDPLHSLINPTLQNVFDKQWANIAGTPPRLMSIAVPLTGQAAKNLTAIVDAKWDEAVKFTTTKWGGVGNIPAKTLTIGATATAQAAKNIVAITDAKWDQAVNTTNRKWSTLAASTHQSLTVATPVTAQAAKNISGILDAKFGESVKFTSSSFGKIASSVKNGISSAAKSVATGVQSQGLYNRAMEATAAQVANVTSKIAAVKSKSVTVDALTAAAQSKLQTMGFTVKHLPNGRVTVTAATAAALAAINDVVRTRYMTVVVSAQASNMRATLNDLKNSANGNIFKAFASGGIEKHVAQIAKPGTWRVWAEDETGGEAYIPLAASKRRRSMAILREVAQQFGMALMPSRGASHFDVGGLRTSRPALEPSSNVGKTGGWVFQEGAVQITNPVPEKPSESMADMARKVANLGLFEED